MKAATDLERFLNLWLALTWRDVRVRYKQSILGIAWAVLLPLSMMLLFTFVFTRAMNAEALLNLSVPYPLYAFAGLVPWTFFSNSLSGCVTSLVANRNLVTKVYFPREVFPLASVSAALLDFIVACAVLIVLMLYFHLRGPFVFQPTAALLVVPLLVLIQTALTVGLGLMLSMANLFYRDVRLLTTALLQLGMFVSAVVIPVPDDGSWIAHLISINPLVPLIEGYRQAILYGQLPAAAGLLYAGAVATVLLGTAWVWFRQASYRFAECI